MGKQRLYNFEEALTKARNGGVITRSSWSEPERLMIYWSNSYKILAPTMKRLTIPQQIKDYMYNKNAYYPEITIEGHLSYYKSGSIGVFNISEEDRQAIDWEVVRD